MKNDDPADVTFVMSEQLAQFMKQNKDNKDAIIIIPKYVLKLSIPGGAKIVYMALLHYVDDDKYYCYPSIKDLSSFTGLCERSITHFINILEKRNLVVRHLRPAKSTRYELNFEILKSNE